MAPFELYNGAAGSQVTGSLSNSLQKETNCMLKSSTNTLKKRKKQKSRAQAVSSRLPSYSFLWILSELKQLGELAESQDSRGCREPKPSAGPGGSGLDHRVTFCFISKCALFLKLVAPYVKGNAGLLGDTSQAFKNRGFAKVRSYLRPTGWGLPPGSGLGASREHARRSLPACSGIWRRLEKPSVRGFKVRKGMKRHPSRLDGWPPGLWWVKFIPTPVWSFSLPQFHPMEELVSLSGSWHELAWGWEERRRGCLAPKGCLGVCSMCISEPDSWEGCCSGWDGTAFGETESRGRYMCEQSAWEICEVGIGIINNLIAVCVFVSRI